MNRRDFIHNSSLTLGAFTIARPSMLSSIFSDPWKIKMLRKDFGIFTEDGGTIAFVLSKSGIIVVDAMFPGSSQHLITELKKKTPMTVQLLINTHHHGDHTAGNISFREFHPRVLAHTNSLKYQQKVALERNTDDKQLYPNQTYEAVWCETIDDEKICLHHFGAGHTCGDSIVHFQHANIAHMGDLLFNRMHPYIDRGANANIKNWIVVLDKAVKEFTKKTVYIFGHAADGYEVTGTAEDLKLFSDYLQKLLAFTEAEIKSGKTKEEFLKTKVLPFETTWKGDGIQMPLKAAYEELTSS